MIFNVVITGIGGQGVITAAGLLRFAAITAGYRLTGADNRGGAQRLGHVSAVIRITDDDCEIRPLAPEIPKQNCDLLISLEASEGLRFADLINPGGTIVMNRRITIPTNIRRARLPYPTLAQCLIAYEALVSGGGRTSKVIELDADGMASDAFRKPILGNLIALGAGLSRSAPPGIVERLTSRLSEEERAAFDLGFSKQGTLT
ncbi:MAG: 2-oxoacid:acceptor oxidoreductase family protein [Candidatus Riflebacteria bacterium]|nr:2-oxoacid:acceptor oxidoreductase family protein [Candidatus Riflebacteria bacterium]